MAITGTEEHGMNGTDRIWSSLGTVILHTPVYPTDIHLSTCELTCHTCLTPVYSPDIHLHVVGAVVQLSHHVKARHVFLH